MDELESRIAALEQWREEIYIHLPAMDECEEGDWLCDDGAYDD